MIQLFEEVKRHKPSVIYIPNVDIWYRTLSESVIKTFTGMLRSLPPTEPVLVLGVLELQNEKDKPDDNMLRDLFGYSMKNQFEIHKPDNAARHEFFEQIVELIRKAPSEFPEPENRKKRKLVELPVAPTPAQPTGPNKDDLKAQKKKDRQTLNMLKIHIQSVMDQIKHKYKKFRTPVVDEAIIGYLYDEQNPNVLSTDLGEEQRQQQQLFRPYEIDKDEKGVQGLREVASGKFYYNLEIVTIEKRLSNGYYKRPKDFLANIKHLAKDAKTVGDAERTLRANEMLANVEVDMAMLETQQPALVAECEAVYEREQERERQRLQKLREAVRRGEDVPRIMPNVPPPNASKTTTETSGPVALGQEIPGGRPQLFPITPSTWPGPGLNAWSTNGTSGHQTNGSTVPSRPQEDSEMLDSQPDVYPPQAQREQSNLYSNSTPSQPNTQGQRFSQKSAHMQVQPGSQLEQYHNSASTTTSGQKSGERSNRSSGPYSVNTQQSNGVRHGDHPDFSTIAPASGGSQLPDTQEVQYPSSQSQPASQSSQPMPPPTTHRPNSIHDVLNEPTGSASAAPPVRTILDEVILSRLHEELVKRSSGSSVEQLEQINASLMDAIWRTRGEWNRNRVSTVVKDAFNATISDIEACQRILKPSQED